MRARDAKLISNVAAAAVTADVFTLEGGAYGITVMATSFGTVTLQKRAADNSTYVNVSSDTAFVANGYTSIALPAGTYRFNSATVTAVYIAVDRIPGE